MTDAKDYVSTDLMDVDTLVNEEQFKDEVQELSDEELDALGQALKDAHAELMKDSDEMLDKLNEMLDEVEDQHAKVKQVNNVSQLVVNRMVAINVRQKVRQMEASEE